MSWSPIDDPQLGLCRQAPSGARLVEPLDAAGLGQLLGEFHGPLALTVGPPADPGGGDLVWLDLAPFTGVGPVTEGGLAVRAGAAATWGGVEVWLAEQGLTLGPVPGWLWHAPIYTTLAEGARRRPSPRYGELLDSLLAVRAALPGGGLTRSAVTPRRAMGPDLARGVVGAQGRAGVPVFVHLQAWPRSPTHAWRAVAHGDWATALAAGVAALRAGGRPSWWRFAAEDDRVVCLAGFAGEAGLARFDEAMGGQSLAVEAARRLEGAAFGPQGDLPTPSAGWVGPVSVAARRAGPDTVVWDLRPEGVTLHGGARVETGEDAGWAALADAAFRALEGKR